MPLFAGAAYVRSDEGPRGPHFHENAFLRWFRGQVLVHGCCCRQQLPTRKESATRHTNSIDRVEWVHKKLSRDWVGAKEMVYLLLRLLTATSLGTLDP